MITSCVLLLVTATTSQVIFGKFLGPDFDEFFALDVYPEVTRTFPPASSRFLPLIPSGFRGFRRESLPETYPDKNKKIIYNPINSY